MPPDTSAELGPRPSTRSSRLGIAAFAVIVVMATIALPFWSSAAVFRTDTDFSIDANESMADDVYVMSDTFTIDGQAERDVFVAARSIEINGDVAGSVNAAGGDISISGTVGGSVRIASGNTNISGTVEGDLLVLGGSTVVEENADIAGDVHVYGGVLDMRGAVGGDITGTVGNLTVDGDVAGDVSADIERLDLTSDAEIGGSLTYVSPTEASIAGGANVAGPIDRDSIAPWGIGSGVRAKFFSPLVRTVWMLATGAVIIALAPRLASALNANLRRPWVAAIVGVMSLALIPIIAILLLVTIVGIPVSLILIVGFVVALYLSQFIVGQRIGTLLLPRAWNDGSRGFLLLSMTIGVILLSVLRFVPVPFVSTFVNALVAILGLGAAVLLPRHLGRRHATLS